MSLLILNKNFNKNYRFRDERLYGCTVLNNHDFSLLNAISFLRFLEQVDSKIWRVHLQLNAPARQQNWLLPLEMFIPAMWARVGGAFRLPPYLGCTEVASLVDTECEIKKCFHHHTLIWLPTMKEQNVHYQELPLILDNCWQVECWTCSLCCEPEKRG